MLSVKNRGEVEVKLWTDEGFAKLTTVGTTVNDGQEHDIRIAFDSETSRLEIHVDETLAAARDIEGKMRGDFPRNLDFGNPWGKDNFDSTLTAFDLDIGNQDYPDYAGDVTAVPTDSICRDDLPTHRGGGARPGSGVCPARTRRGPRPPRRRPPGRASRRGCAPRTEPPGHRRATDPAPLPRSPGVRRFPGGSPRGDDQRDPR